MWTIVGTIVATDKQVQAKLNLPFNKLTKGALKALKRGWFWEAVIKMFTKAGEVFYVQCTTWRDKKQVTFLSSNCVGSSQGGRKGTRMKEKIARTLAQSDYTESYAATDHSNCDSADFSMTIQTHILSPHLLLGYQLSFTHVLRCDLFRSEQWRPDHLF